MSKDVTQKDGDVKNALPTVTNVVRKTTKKSKKNISTKNASSAGTKYTVEVPEGGSGKEGYASYVLKQERLTPAAAMALKDMLAGLQSSGKRLSDGRNVTSKERAIIWLLENLTK